jgi:hypothetical protein
MDFLPGAKTFIGLAIALLGTLATALHWDWWGAISPDVETAANTVVSLVGIVIGIYGKFMANKRAAAAVEAAKVGQ